MKRCPKCAEKVQDAATVCRFCGAEQPKRESNAALWAVILGGVVIFGVVGNLKGSPKKPVPAVAKAPEKPRDPRNKCQSGPNGEIYAASARVRQQMRNPPSFEHVDSRWGEVQGGVFPVTMTYRATNGFGGVDTAVAKVEVRLFDCAARVTRID